MRNGLRQSNEAIKVMTVSEGDVRNAKHPGQQSVNLSMGMKDIHF